ncbi:SRPBCC domain-containing protein [Spirillospora sp. NPDC047279]|uniref:SRPBCC domain-containing protein n=1 Tax=Spirillospora sp. NPDC047279 TaxID=3155478 RepID=UPI0033C9DF7F
MKIRRITLGTAALLPLSAAGLFAWGTLAPHEVRTSVEIAAPADKVWQVLTDFQSYPEWNPFIVSVQGTARQGTRLDNTLRGSDGGTMNFRPRVLKADPGRELRWIGRTWVPGIVDGEHYFLIEPAGNGTVRLTQGERFSGALVPVAGGLLRMADEFDAMNAALKARAERA